MSRQQLAFQFWPDSTEAQARANLRKALYRLRQAFPEVDEYIDLDHATIGLRTDAPWQIDVARYESALAAAAIAAGREKVELLEGAISCYKGDLLPGIYDDWVFQRREELRTCYLDALEELAQLLESRREFKQAATFVRLRLKAEPLEEVNYRRLMRLQALSDDVAGALQTYHHCVTLLEDELGVEPAPATEEAYRRLLKREQTPQPLEWARRRMPLVGREAPWSVLLRTWKAVMVGRARVVLIKGEAGIGKTRLADEFVGWARRQGIAALTAGAFPTASQLPLAPVTDWLRAEPVRRALPALAQHWRTELARVLPELLANDPTLERPRPMTKAWQQQHLFHALAEAIDAVGEPLVLFLDDLHWADTDTHSWLHYLAQRKANHRCLLLATLRSEELALDGALRLWQRTMTRMLATEEITLARLDRPAVATLAASILGRKLPEAESNALYRETEGNPLFAVEMVRARLGHMDSELPEKVRSVIDFRFDQLRPQTQNLASAAAVIGRRFSVPVLAAASEAEEEPFLSCLDELWQRQILTEEGEDGYSFSHNKMREVALARLSPARRRWWHRRVAEALEDVYAGYLEPYFGRVAQHYEASGEVEKAVAYYRRAGETAQRLYGSNEAIRVYEKALALLDEAAPSGLRLSLVDQRRALLQGLGESLALRGRNVEARAAFLEALAGEPAPLREQQSFLHRLVGDSYRAQGAYKQAKAAYSLAETVLPTALENARVPEVELWLEIQLSRLQLFYGRGESGRMQTLLDEIRPLIERRGTSGQRARFLTNMRRAALRNARYAPPLDRALALNELSIATAEESGDRVILATNRLGAGLTCLLSGDFASAEAHLQTALELAEKIGFQWMRTLCLTYLAMLERSRGVPALVADYARQSLDLAETGGWDTYTGAARANLAWVAWRKGDSETARQMGEEALELWRGSVYPFQWLALWLLLDIALMEEDIEKALNFAEALLAPTQHRLPASVCAALEAALQAEKTIEALSYLKEARRLAQKNAYL